MSLNSLTSRVLHYTHSAIEQAAAEAGKPRAAAGLGLVGLAPLAAPSERWRATLGELRSTVELEHRSATDANASAHAELQALRLTSGANMSRLEEQLSSLRATYAPPAYVAAAPLTAAGLTAAGLTAAGAGGLASVSGGLFAQPPSVGDGGSLAVRTYRSVTAPEASTAVVDYPADAATGHSSTQAAPLVSLAADQQAPPLDSQLSGGPESTTAIATRHTAPSTQRSSPNATALPQSAVAEAVATPAVTNANPCAGKRCPTQYDMVDRGDHCACRLASATP